MILIYYVQLKRLKVEASRNDSQVLLKLAKYDKKKVTFNKWRWWMEVVKCVCTEDLYWI